jgi:hypothetical protein
MNDGQMRMVLQALVTCTGMVCATVLAVMLGIGDAIVFILLMIMILAMV